MPVIKLGAIISDIRGSTGGVTFSKNRSGNYVRLWAQTSKTATLKRQAQRARYSPLPQMWRDLSNAQRTAWGLFASLPAQELQNSMGEDYFASGWGWFVKCNSRLMRADESTIDNPPVSARPSAPTITTVTFEEDVMGDPELSLTYPLNEFSGLTLILESGLAPRGGRTSWPSTRALLAADSAAGASSEDYSSEFIDRYGTPGADDQLFTFVSAQSDEGLRSTPTEHMTTYTI